MSEGSMTGDREAPGPAVQAIRSKCPLYPSTTVVRTEGKAAIVRQFHVNFASVVSYAAALAQTESQYRVSFGRSRQKRGPPRIS